MPLPFRPSCFPAALGPLPHTSAHDAWEACIRYLPVVLPLPLLALDGEDPGTLAADGFGGVTITGEQWQFDRGAATAALDDLYLAYLENDASTRALDLAALDEWGQREARIRRAEAVSTVLMGPVSLALRLVDRKDQPALNDGVIVDALSKHLNLRLQWQETFVERSARASINWLYEPYFDVVGSPFSPVDWRAAHELLGDTFGGMTGARAVWVAEATDVPALLAGEVVEVAGLPLPLPTVVEGWAPALKQFVERGGAIGWGIVPQTAEGLAHARVGRLAARFGAVLRALEDAGLATADVVRASLIMPEDTLSALSPGEAEAALALTSQLSGMLRHSYGLD
jgi:hypothetical protein